MAEDEEQTYLFVGCSDVGLFTLVPGSQVRVLRFSTATAKGLGQDNKNSQQIWDLLSTKYARLDYSAVVWMFGNVDVKFSYYYKLCREWDGKLDGKPDPLIVMDQCATAYMRFVMKVHDTFVRTKDPAGKTVVLGAEPNGASPNLFFDQCLKYFVVQDTEENRRRIQESLSQYHPELLRLQFNRMLEKICKENGFYYIDLDLHLLKEEKVTASLDQSVTKPEFVDISPTSVHLNWEGALELYIEKLREIGVCIENTLDLKQTRDEYLNEKKNRKRKPIAIINERWERSLKTHIDDRDAKLT
jgi:hypothetical protein